MLLERSIFILECTKLWLIGFGRNKRSYLG